MNYLYVVSTFTTKGSKDDLILWSVEYLQSPEAATSYVAMYVKSAKAAWESKQITGYIVRTNVVNPYVKCFNKDVGPTLLHALPEDVAFYSDWRTEQINLVKEADKYMKQIKVKS